MATIEEDYVSFEIAKLLKEKGFDQNCATYYLDGQVWRHYHGEVIPKGKQIYAAPTQAMAMKWLREVYNIFIEISTSIDLNGKYHFRYTILDKECKYVRKGYTYFDWTYEEAIEKALKFSLENLI